MKKILVYVLLFLIGLLVGGLFYWFFWGNKVVPVNAEGLVSCQSTGPQCGTDNGYKIKDRDYDWECPAGYPNHSVLHSGYCYKGLFIHADFPEDYALKVKDYDICSNGYEVNPENEGQCRKSCHTEVIQYDACDPVGQCPTECGQEATRVPDGEGGYISCDATKACEVLAPKVLCIDTTALNYGDASQECRYPGPVSAPQCNDTTPLVLPSNVHVVRSGSDATVNFFTSSNNANIYYKNVDSKDWEHSVRDIAVTGGYVSYTIHDLKPAEGYTFGIQAANSCAGGEVVLAVIVDGPESVTFGFSYWEWLK